ncbi:MAG: PilZ domain-containing protein [Planctomycetes bacterium]|nr:PilZ domain-containing protein [Planctomycetota bacterium]
MTSPTPQSERRRSIRALGTFPVRLSPRPTDAPAVLRDISEIGLACTSFEELPEMTQVSLNFSLPGATEVHHVQGAVVRCEKLQSQVVSRSGPKWDLAVYFTEIQPVTRAAIRNYVGKSKKAR